MAALLAACGPANGPSVAEGPLDRLAFVPSMPEAGVESAFVIGRYEVTRAEWDGSGGTEPVTFVARGQAEAWLAERGLRLPTRAEWRLAAGGDMAYRFPWGGSWSPARANCLDLGLGRSLAGGVLESSRSPFGCYDTSGNVWEWLADPADAEAANQPFLFEPVAPGRMGLVAGGSYLTTHAFAQTASVRAVEPGLRACDIGFRWAGGAAEVLGRWASDPVWGGDEAAWAALARRSPASLLEFLEGVEGADPRCLEAVRRAGQ